MDKLTGFYKSLDTADKKTQWVDLINTNPTEAIMTYYTAFCKDKDQSKGYCDLLQLFRLLGTLEERKAKGESIVATGSTSDTADQATLEPIHDALIRLGEKIDNSKSKQSAQQSSDTSNQEKLAELQQQIEELKKKKEEDIQRLTTEHEQALEKSNLSVEEINKKNAQLEESVKAMKEQTKALNDMNNKEIEEIISMSNEDKSAKIQQLEQKLKSAETEAADVMSNINTTTQEENKETEENATKEETAAPAEEAAEERNRIEVAEEAEDPTDNKKKDIISSLHATGSDGDNQDPNEAVKTPPVETISCQGKQGPINAEFEKKLFTLYETAKDILHSDMLILIGCLHFYKLDKLTTTQGSETEKILTALEKALFIQLTTEEYEKITSQLVLLNNTLNETFIKICERDTNYNNNDKNKGGKAIMVYALLWIFHFNKNIAINASISTYEQIISNKSLFDKHTQFINDTNCESIIAVGKKIEESIVELAKIKTSIEKSTFKSNLINLKVKYAHILKENKSVLALLKRRDDWVGDVAKKHKRFNLDIKGQDTIADPLQLTYNDTPLVIPETLTGNPQNMTHKYDFYGFDSVYSPEFDNFNIASSLVENFKFEEDTRPLCFIGYGQSGSGKTSTLIYLDVPGKEQDGIIMQLLNKLEPDDVTVSMIEIYEAGAAKASDESCIGIGTSKHPNKGKIVQCNASNTEESKFNDADNATQPTQLGGAVKERIKVEGFKPIPAEIKQGKQPIEPSMRYITIGEVLDKQYDDKLGRPRPHNAEDQAKQTIFKKNRVKCPEEDHETDGWFYTHNESGDDCMDKDFGLKHYILMGFECREIATTSNNKQSSRSHVVVSLKLDWNDDSKQTRYIYVCDLAGVENEFNCNTPASTDIIRMKAKTKANKNYSNIVGPGEIEDWKKLKEKRAGNIVKYVHKDIHISKTDSGPTCWPDGTPNEAGDIDTIRLEYSKELMRIFWHTHSKAVDNEAMKIPDNTGGNIISIKVKGKDKPIEYNNGNNGITGDAVFEYFEEKLKKLPIKRDEEGNIIGIKLVKENINEFFNSGSMNSLVNGLSARGEVKYTPITKDDLDGMKWDTWKNMGWTGTNAANHIELLKSVFNPIEMPDCKSSYEAGFKRACDIRTKEGYVINSTLAQLTRDVKRISKYAIKERLETPTGETETGDAEESPTTYPCLFADTYDEYSKYSKSTHPLMNWYDIDDPRKEDFGSILTAMCLISDPDKNTDTKPDWTIRDKLNLLKTFRFNYCTVLNETFMMRRGDEIAKTPAGNEIYVNNPPLPPYINVGILENSYKEYIFYENDPRTDTDTDTDTAHIEKKIELFLTLCKHFLNLIVKMFRHPIYENDAIKFMQQLGSISNSDKPSIIFQSKEEIKELFKNGRFKILIKEVLKPKIKEFINKIKTNNNATFIGTIQTTEQVNRVSDKIVISEALAPEEKLDSMGDENINRKLLKRLFVSSYLTATQKKTSFTESKSKYTRPKSNQSRELSAILYECLYEIRKLYIKEELTIASKTMEERDIDGMVSAIETAFPLMSLYLDPVKINKIWNLISKMERGISVMKNKPAEIYDVIEGEYDSYPYTGDITSQNGGGGGNGIGRSQRKRKKKKEQENKHNDSDPEKLNSKFIPTNPKNALSKFNEILINNLKDEPSLEYITLGVWNKLPKKKHKVSYKYFKQLVGIKNGKRSLMQYLVTDDFFAAVYGDYISQTIENNWDAANNTFTDFTPVKTAEAREHLSKNLSKYKVRESYPPENTGQQGGGDTGNTLEITTNMVVEQINKIGEKIDSLGGIDNSGRDKHTEDLANIDDAVTKLQNHLTELYSGEDNISDKLQEALRQLQEASSN